MKAFNLASPISLLMITKKLTILHSKGRKSNRKFLAPLLANPRVLQTSDLVIQEPYHTSFNSYTYNHFSKNFFYIIYVLKISEFVYILIKLKTKVLSLGNLQALIIILCYPIALLIKQGQSSS